NGSFAWMQLLWPHVAIAESQNPAVGYHHAGDGVLGVKYMGATPGPDKPFYYSPEAPWMESSAPKARRAMTAFVTGKDETHTQTPQSASTIGNGRNMLATVASMQT